MDLSPISLLPRELRDIIWEAVLRQPEKLDLKIEENANISLLPAASQQNVLALAFACKQLLLRIVEPILQQQHVRSAHSSIRRGCNVRLRLVVDRAELTECT
jgi:hypothetical protein